MSRQLPDRASLQHLKNQAQDLRSDFNDGKPDAAARVKDNLPRAAAASAELKATGLKLSDAQLVIAREYGFPTWARLKRHVETRSGVEQGEIALVQRVLSEEVPDIKSGFYRSRPLPVNWESA